MNWIDHKNDQDNGYFWSVNIWRPKTPDRLISARWLNSTHPGIPPLSMWLASVTSLDQTSNCHLTRPKTPQCTRPVWMPTRMFTFTAITSRTSLQKNQFALFYFVYKHRFYIGLQSMAKWECLKEAKECEERNSFLDFPAVQPQQSHKTAVSFVFLFADTNTHAMASIISSPISTAQWAWSGRGSGSPETQ